jgi:hypothetical protein
MCVAYAIFEVGATVYDIGDLAVTGFKYARGKASGAELSVTAAGVGAGIVGFGGGYGRAARGAIGFAEGLGKTAFTPNRLQHASRHLTDAGLLPNWSKRTGELFTEMGSKILENPLATFDHKLGGTAVKGFHGKVDGTDVVFFVFKEGKYQGEVATSVVPTSQQMRNWGLR